MLTEKDERSYVAACDQDANYQAQFANWTSTLAFAESLKEDIKRRRLNLTADQWRRIGGLIQSVRRELADLANGKEV